MVLEDNDKKYRYEATRSLLLDLLKAACGLSILLARPSGSAYKPVNFFSNGEFDRTRFRRTIRHAKARGYIDVVEKHGEMTINLREEGRAKAMLYALEDIQITEPAIWDKKWRMVMFDIPEEMRAHRKVFKTKLDELGFAQVQKSVYLHAFPCHNEIEYIRSMYSIEQYVRLAILDRIEGDEALRKRFGV